MLQHEEIEGNSAFPGVTFLSLGSNPLANQTNQARLMAVIAQQVVRKMSYMLKGTEFASYGICYFCKWRCQENKWYLLAFKRNSNVWGSQS